MNPDYARMQSNINTSMETDWYQYFTTGYERTCAVFDISVSTQCSVYNIGEWARVILIDNIYTHPLGMGTSILATMQLGDAHTVS